MQGGRYVAGQILHPGSRRKFHYFDKGIMATIGRRAAVAQIGPLQFTGFIGWMAWLVVHLYYLIGFENRLKVMLRWAWYYVARPARGDPMSAVVRRTGTGPISPCNRGRATRPTPRFPWRLSRSRPTRSMTQ
jgi:hypothetical protein